ncbi:MAG: hypothetical protein WC782_01505 [Methylococcaceae bacterium]|jgi:hypothetical protein
MIFRKFSLMLWLVFSMPFSNAADGQEIQLQPFNASSYQEILAANKEQAFVLVLWSTTCSSCLKDMDLLKNIHQEQPSFKIITLSTDDLSETDEIKTILSQHELGNLENWVFADPNSQKLRFQIDPKWYGELPRTYFFDAQHQRTGVSGAFSRDKFLAMLQKIVK